MLFVSLLFLFTTVTGDEFNVTDRDGAEIFSCDPADDTCYIYVSAPCSDSDCSTELTFNCPTGTCTECIIDCHGDFGCRLTTINSNDCGTVRVSAVSGASTLRNSEINGPTNGDLYVTVDTDGDLALASAVINGPLSGNLYVSVSGSGDDTLFGANVNGLTADNVYIDVAGNADAQSMIVNAQSVTNKLDIQCDSDCRNSEINCPENSGLYGPSCFIYCTGSGGDCRNLAIDSVSGTPLDVKIFCESSESLLCGNTEINCDANDPCTMGLNNGEWSCDENSACNTPTGEPTMLPSSEPSEIPSMEPSKQPSLMPSTNEPSIIPSFEPTTMPSVPSVEPTGIPSTKAPSSMPTEPGEAITSTTIDADSSPGATVSTSMPSVDPGDGGGSNKDDNDGLSDGIIALIAILCLVGSVIVIVIIVVCVRNKRGSTNATNLEETVIRDNKTEAPTQEPPKEKNVTSGGPSDPVGGNTAPFVGENTAQSDAKAGKAGEGGELEMVTPGGPAERVEDLNIDLDVPEDDAEPPVQNDDDNQQAVSEGHQLQTGDTKQQKIGDNMKMTVVHDEKPDESDRDSSPSSHLVHEQLRQDVQEIDIKREDEEKAEMFETPGGPVEKSGQSEQAGQSGQSEQSGQPEQAGQFQQSDQFGTDNEENALLV